jgi:hypothetical protein
VIALVVTPDGFPLAYEVMNGNTADRTTLREFLRKIETTYGNARRVWVMDRGIPTEAILKEMREPERQTFYLVGTPKGRINQHEKKWLDLPWQKVRDSVEVKLCQHDGELYVLAKSSGRQAYERQANLPAARNSSSGPTPSQQGWSFQPPGAKPTAPIEACHALPRARRLRRYRRGPRTSAREG